MGSSADKHEAALDREFGNSVGLDVTQPQTLDFILAENLLNNGVPNEVDLRNGEGSVLEDPAGAQLVATVDNRDLESVAGDEQTLIDGAIAATDNGHRLVAEKRGVTGAAIGNTAPYEPIFTGGNPR